MKLYRGSSVFSKRKQRERDMTKIVVTSLTHPLIESEVLLTVLPSDF